jgi:hypothetical protein
MMMMVMMMMTMTRKRRRRSVQRSGACKDDATVQTAQEGDEDDDRPLHLPPIAESELAHKRLIRRHFRSSQAEQANTRRHERRRELKELRCGSSCFRCPRSRVGPLVIVWGIPRKRDVALARLIVREVVHEVPKGRVFCGYQGACVNVVACLTRTCMSTH